MTTVAEAPAEPKAARSARRAERRRREILDAALRVFDRVGFEAASTRLIAQEADVSEGTIYNYFPDKGELYIQALKENSGLAVLVEQLRRADASVETLLGEVADWRAAHLPAQAALMELWAEVMSRPKLRQRYHDAVWAPAAEAFEAAIRGAEARGERFAAPAPIAARIFMSGLLGLALMSLADERLGDVIRPGSEVNARHLLWRGILAERER
jgi:AcrR family transcriptional regulator